MPMILDVVHVVANPDYTLFLEFENGEQRVFDMVPLMDKKPFCQLKGSPLFMQASVDYGSSEELLRMAVSKLMAGVGAVGLQGKGDFGKSSHVRTPCLVQGARALTRPARGDPHEGREAGTAEVKPSV